jgi:hypothetical protein
VILVLNLGEDTVQVVDMVVDMVRLKVVDMEACTVPLLEDLRVSLYAVSIYLPSSSCLATLTGNNRGTVGVLRRQRIKGLLPEPILSSCFCTAILA